MLKEGGLQLNANVGYFLFFVCIFFHIVTYAGSNFVVIEAISTETHIKQMYRRIETMSMNQKEPTFFFSSILIIFHNLFSSSIKNSKFY